MKQITLIFALLIVFSVNAQKKHIKQPEFTAEQKTQLAIKEMTVHLDLSAKQIAQIQPLIAERITVMDAKKEERKALKEKREKLSATQIFDAKMKRLEKQEELQNKMKKILDKEQYATWKKMHQKHAKSQKMKTKKSRVKKQCHKEKA